MKIVGMSTWVNFLDYSATVIPVTTVDKEVDKFDENYKALDETDEKVWKCCMLSSSPTWKFCAKTKLT